MQQDYCHISVVLDRSGSMRDVQNATIEGFNGFLASQRAQKGKGSITLVQFDHAYEVNYLFFDLAIAPSLNLDTYKPRGVTALYDAIGKAINDTGAALKAMPEEQRPSRVLFVIQTDGFENASREFDAKKIQEMIAHQKEKYNWEFVFLGAGEDSIISAQQIGIRAGATLVYHAHNISGALNTVSHFTASYRRAATNEEAKCVCFSDEDRVSAASATNSSL